MNQSEVKNLVDKAMSSFISEDGFLLEHAVNERTITHKFAEYLKSYLHEYSNDEWNVDCEYNKDLFDTKHLIGIPKLSQLFDQTVNIDDDKARTVYPDIIVHKRGQRGKPNNLLVIEVKKTDCTKEEILYDELKLQAFISEQFNYNYGVHIIFNIGSNYKKYPNCKWYTNTYLL